MNNIQRQLSFFLLLSILLAWSYPVSAAGQIVPAATFHLTGQVYYSTMEGGFYGIIGDDGVKYQPTNLPRKFKKEGLALSFDAKLKDSGVSIFQWGTIIELANVNQLNTTVSADERKAIFVLLKRMDAFNNKDLAKLQQIDLQSRQLTNEQFQNWLSQYHNYTLEYVDISSATTAEITGACYYTRELVNGMTRYGTTELAGMSFTIKQTTDGWRIKEVESLQNPIFTYQTDSIADLRKKAMEKYKTNNLATLGQ